MEQAPEVEAPKRPAAAARRRRLPLTRCCNGGWTGGRVDERVTL